MIELKVIFYKGPGKALDKAIRWWTGSPYSHCELLFPDGRIFYSDGWNDSGVRYSVNYNLVNWDSITLPISTEVLRHLQNWCDEKVGQGYDWTGVIRFVVPFMPQSDRRWFCSELCGAALKYIGCLSLAIDVHGLSPKDLYELLTKPRKSMQ